MPGATKVVGFPPVLEKRAITLTDPGRYQNLTDDFSAQINAFKPANAEIVTGVVIPPDFTTFWNQAKQQGFTPKVASIGKAILFPQSVEALGDAGHNLSSEVWWSPSHPFKSSLTGETAAELAAAFTEATGPALDAADRLRPRAVRGGGRCDEARRRSDRRRCRRRRRSPPPSSTRWSGRSPGTAQSLPPFAAKNIAKTPLVGGQWRLKDGGGYDLVIIDNTDRARTFRPAARWKPIA